MSGRADDWAALQAWCERAGLTDAPAVLADMARSGALDRLTADAVRTWQQHAGRTTAPATSDSLLRVVELMEDGFTPAMVSDAADLAGGVLRLLRLLNSPGVVRVLERVEHLAAREDGLERAMTVRFLQAMARGSMRWAGEGGEGARAAAPSWLSLLGQSDTRDALRWLVALARSVRED